MSNSCPICREAVHPVDYSKIAMLLYIFSSFILSSIGGGLLLKYKETYDVRILATLVLVANGLWILENMIAVCDNMSTRRLLSISLAIHEHCLLVCNMMVVNIIVYGKASEIFYLVAIIVMINYIDMRSSASTLIVVYQFRD